MTPSKKRRPQSRPCRSYPGDVVAPRLPAVWKWSRGSPRALPPPSEGPNPARQFRPLPRQKSTGLGSRSACATVGSWFRPTDFSQARYSRLPGESFFSGFEQRTRGEARRRRQEFRSNANEHPVRQFLGTPFHKYDHVCGEGFLAQTRRERRAYPSGVCKE